MADRAHLERLTRKLADEGRLIEAGWVAMRLAVMPMNSPADQLDAMRLAYMAGAQHLFASIMTAFDPGAEPTDADMSRINLINAELETFRKEVELRVARTKGQA